MTNMRFNIQPVTPRVVVVRKQSSLVMGILIGLPGWLATFGVLAVLLIGYQRNELKCADLNRAYDARISQLRQQEQQAQEKRRAELEVAQEDMPDSQARYLELSQQTRKLQATKASYLGKIAALAPASTGTNNPDSTTLAAEKQKLLEQYVTGYNQLKGMLTKLQRGGSLTALDAFAARTAKTPLGPAAAFYAAEATRKSGAKERAAAKYADLVIRFPGNPYIDSARAWIQSFQGKSFVATDPGIKPYRPLTYRIQ